MNILFITRRYYPHGDATSAIVHNLALEFIDQGHYVKVVSVTANSDDAKINDWEGVLVSNNYLPASMDREQMFEEYKSFPTKTIYAIVQKTISKTEKQLFRQSKALHIEPILRKQYERSLTDLFKKEHYDLCIATLLPIEAVIAAKNKCPKETVFAVYQLDTYWNNEDLPAQYIEERKQFEKKLIEESDYIITTPLIKKMDEEVFPKHNGIIIETEFPLIKRCNFDVLSIKDTANNPKHCAFLGTLYPRVRPPEQVINMISKMIQNDVLFDFYGTGQNLITIQPVYEKIKNRVILHGPISSEEAKKVRAEADYLLNIDNTTTMQVPSKIFEYISAGKPIINLFFNKKSPTIHYLERYPDCINLDLFGDHNVEVKKLESYIFEQRHMRIQYKEIEERYKENVPRYVADQIINAYKYIKVKQG